MSWSGGSTPCSTSASARTERRAAATSLSVALLHYTAPPIVGGVEQVIGQHGRLVADAGHRVRIVAGRGASQDRRIAFVRLPLADTLHPRIVELQARLDAGDVPASFAPLVAGLADGLATALAGVDVVIAHNVCSLGRNLALTSALRVVAARTGALRLVLWHHDLAWTLPAYLPSLHEGHPWDLLRSPWPGATQVAVSEARRAELVALMGLDPATVRVVPNGVDLAGLLGLDARTMAVIRDADLLALDPLVLLPVRITPRKNVELALRVVASMRAGSRPAAGLVVTGPLDPHDRAAGSYLAALLALRRDLGLERAAVFLAETLPKPASDALVHGLYRLADLLLLPSLDEGFGLPILEAAVHRLPIICSDLPALRDLAGDAAVYVAPDADPADLAALALERLDRDALVTFARRVRTEFCWEAVYRSGIAPLLEG